MNLRRPARLTSQFASHPSLATMLRVASYPIRYWNWKAAALQIAIRCNAYFFLALHHAHQGGHSAGLRAAWVEAIYVCVTAGFYSALQQGAMSLRPLWMSNLVIIAAVPVLSQTIDSLLQYAAGTTHLRATSIGMVLWGLLSSAFHLHMMRNGALLVGEQSRSFTSDLRRIPWLVATFVAAPVVAVLGLLRPAQQAADSEAAA